jgi:CBS domain-containing protein
MSLDRFRTALATVAEQDTVETAALVMRDRRVGSLIVTNAERFVGILTDRDIVLRVVAEGLDPTQVKVGSVVSYGPLTLSIHDGIETASQRMRQHGIRRLPILDEDGKPVGIVTADDLLALLGSEMASVCDAIHNPCDASESR